MALSVVVFEVASYSTTTTPKTVTVTGALAGDWLGVIAGGDQSSGNSVTAVTTTTTGGTTTGWTELAEDLDSGTNVDWYHAATAQVTADGDVTVSIARTMGGTPGAWGGFVVRARGSAGIELLGQLGTAGATEVINGTVADGSAVAFASFDWEPQAPATTFTPGGSTTIESQQVGVVYTILALLWEGQTAGTRDYGSTNSASATIKAVALEFLASADSSPVSFRPGKTWKRRFKHPQRLAMEVRPAPPADDPPFIPPVMSVAQRAPSGPVVVLGSGGPDSRDTPTQAVVVSDLSRRRLSVGSVFIDTTVPEAAVPSEPVMSVPVRMPEAGRVWVGSTPVEPPATPTDTPTAAVISVAPRIPQPAFIYHTQTFQDTPIAVGDTPTRTVMSVPVGPRPAGVAITSSNPADTGTPAGTPPQPTIVIGQTPRTPGVQFVHRAYLEDSGRVSSVVVTPRIRPAAGSVFISAGRADPPQPTPIPAQVYVRHPAPQAGRIITGRGFAPALPSLFEGTVTGGRLASASAVGGQMSGAAVQGVARTGAVVLGAVSGVTSDQVYGVDVYGDGLYPGDWAIGFNGGTRAANVLSGGRR